MKATPKFKSFGHWGSIAMLALMVGLGANNMAQAWQSQASKSTSKQQESQTRQVQENRSVVIVKGVQNNRVNRAMVVLPFPPCYSVDYQHQPCCYGDQQGQGSGAATGVHIYGN